jgi:hypothetical protein
MHARPRAASSHARRPLQRADILSVGATHEDETMGMLAGAYMGGMRGVGTGSGARWCTDIEYEAACFPNRQSRVGSSALQSRSRLSYLVG